MMTSMHGILTILILLSCFNGTIVASPVDPEGSGPPAVGSGGPRSPRKDPVRSGDSGESPDAPPVKSSDSEDDEDPISPPSGDPALGPSGRLDYSGFIQQDAVDRHEITVNSEDLPQRKLKDPEQSAPHDPTQTKGMINSNSTSQLHPEGPPKMGEEENNKPGRSEVKMKMVYQGAGALVMGAGSPGDSRGGQGEKEGRAPGRNRGGMPGIKGHIYDALLPAPLDEKDLKEKLSPCTKPNICNGGNCTDSENPHGLGYYCTCGDKAGGLNCEFPDVCENNNCTNHHPNAICDPTSIGNILGRHCLMPGSMIPFKEPDHEIEWIG